MIAILINHTEITPSKLGTIIDQIRAATFEQYNTKVWSDWAETLLDRVALYCEQSALTPPAQKDLLRLQMTNQWAVNQKEVKRVNNRIHKYAFFNRNALSLDFGGMTNLETTTHEVVQRFGDQQKMLREWLESAASEGAKSKPTEKWLKSSQQQLSGVDETALTLGFIAIAEAVVADLKQEHKGKFEYGKVYPTTPEWLSGMVWYAGAHLSYRADMRQAIDLLAQWCLKKFPGLGPFGAKTGNACLRAFAIMPGMEGISALFRFKAKTSNRNVLKLLETLLDEAAVRQKMSRADLEDLSVPDFGLGADQIRFETLGEVTAQLRIDQQADAVLIWQNGQGKVVKSVPAAVKEQHKSALKSLQLAQKELQQVLSAQAFRLESAYLLQRRWSLDSFTQRYVDHPVLRTMAARLIWQVEENGRSTSAIYHEGRWQNPAGNGFDGFSADATVSLWHPLEQVAADVLAWREWLISHEITQPFKQAFRELYVVTPPEVNTLTYSNRFAAHIIRQHQFTTLAKQRDWQYHLQGQWDSHNIPTKIVENWGYKIEFWVEAGWDNTPASDAGIFLYVSTDQVRFYQQNQLVELPQVPPLLFSEVMREVDLFVSVCSIGNDPNWQDSGDRRFNHYWQEYAFSNELSESAKIRRSVLERLIPRLKIAPLCHFADNYLVVKGKRHSYKIHCASGNILMSPNDQYLCIVPDGRSDQNSKLYLPFEGDRMLSIIISKALLLAEDDKITDPTILRQL